MLKVLIDTDCMQYRDLISNTYVSIWTVLVVARRGEKILFMAILAWSAAKFDKMKLQFGELDATFFTSIK